MAGSHGRASHGETAVGQPSPLHAPVRLGSRVRQAIMAPMAAGGLNAVDWKDLAMGDIETRRGRPEVGWTCTQRVTTRARQTERKRPESDGLARDA